MKMMDESIDSYFAVLTMNIKANKELIILSLLSRKPMCGFDLIKEIYSETESFLSQGTIIPSCTYSKEGAFFKASTRRTI